MTTPTPPATALRGLVDFVRSVAGDNDADCNGWASAASAALAAWESRGPMALDPTLDSLVYDEMTAEDGAALGERIRRLLVSLDHTLTGERGP